MRFKVANYSRLEIRLDTLHIYTRPAQLLVLQAYINEVFSTAVPEVEILQNLVIHFSRLNGKSKGSWICIALHCEKLVSGSEALTQLLHCKLTIPAFTS